MTNFRTYNESVRFFKLCKELKLPYSIKDQLLRAAASITLNLAEGSGKHSAKDQARFYRIAYASLRECRAVFDLYGDEANRELVALAGSLGAMMYRLIGSRGAI